MTHNNYYYVYWHIDPNTDEVVYIGHGCKGRAWTHGSRKTALRSQEHLDWLEEKNNQNFLPTDFVFILLKNLTKNEACAEEQNLIRTYNPRFNKPLGKSLLKINSEDFELIQELRSNGLSYKKISEETGFSTMTVFRVLNNKNRNKPNEE